MAIYLSSDLHFCHDKDFIYQSRGFRNVTVMNKEIIKNFQSAINPDDDLYLLGDNMLGTLEDGMYWFHQLPGKIHLIWGNHDTDTRKKALFNSFNVVEICGYATVIKSGKWHFYLSHYPTMTSNYDDGITRRPLINLFGHTHQKEKFYNNNPYMYHVGIDSHNYFPIGLEQIKKDILKQRKELYNE